MPPIARTNLLTNADLLREFAACDEFYRIEWWPARFMMLLQKEHKDRRERFNLWNFLWTNGMQPHRATYWVLWHESYDMQAHRDLRALEAKVRTPDGVAQMQKYPTWILDMTDPNTTHKKRRRQFD